MIEECVSCSVRGTAGAVAALGVSRAHWFTDKEMIMQRDIHFKVRRRTFLEEGSEERFAPTDAM